MTINARTIGLAMALAASLAVGIMSTTAQACDCTTQGECSYGTCCFSNGFCTPDNLKCKVSGMQGTYVCGAGDQCTYHGGNCGGEGG